MFTECVKIGYCCDLEIHCVDGIDAVHCDDVKNYDGSCGCIIFRILHF